MKVLLVNGSPHEKGCTYTALAECAGALQAEGIDTEIFWITNEPVRGCQACMACRKTGYCVYADDVVNTLIDKIAQADGVIIGSPTYYAGMNGLLKAVLDRAFYAGFAKFAMKPAAGIASARRAGTTLAITQINKFFEICQMPVIGSSYWPMVFGKQPSEVEQDLEGLHTMRMLAHNMAYELRCREAGEKAGVAARVIEDKVMTNFIR